MVFPSGQVRARMPRATVPELNVRTAGHPWHVSGVPPISSKHASPTALPPTSAAVAGLVHTTRISRSRITIWSVTPAMMAANRSWASLISVNSSALPSAIAASWSMISSGRSAAGPRSAPDCERSPTNRWADLFGVNRARVGLALCGV
ncbi:MAG: hypothetical protein A2X50_16835 [Candidatus Rokubacteria bacterium GWF2_70_14]|nr:MAG: hypothetical protein A2X53_17220 [Candidatus Rokubacteria bacterium GWA2_70_23]OGK90461.1 MAG: hypothetical protein A2X50_16835 [Candidatus Rokubacteria bacterium GWF2_70_14]